jgi:putative transposase
MEAKNAINEYVKFYNNERMHQSLEYFTPAKVYFNNSNLIYRILWLSVQNLSLGNNCFSLKHPDEILNFINYNPI